MENKKLPLQGLQLTARSSRLAIRLSVMATLLMGLGIGILLLSRSRQHWTLPIGLTAVGLAVVLIAMVVGTESRRLLRARKAARVGQPSATFPVFWNLPPAPRPVNRECLIPVEAQHRKSVRKWLIGSAAYCAFMIVMAVVFWVGFGSAATAAQHAVRAMLLYIYGPALALVVIVFLIDGLRRWRSLKQRIGTDGSALLYDQGSGEVRRYEWDQVLANRRSLLAGAKMIPLYGGRRHEAPPIFPLDELRELVLARLPHSAFVGDLHFWWTALRRGSAIVIWQCTLIALALGLLTTPPERFAALRAMYQGFLKSRMQ